MKNAASGRFGGMIYEFEIISKKHQARKNRFQFAIPPQHMVHQWHFFSPFLMQQSLQISLLDAWQYAVFMVEPRFSRFLLHTSHVIYIVEATPL